MHKRKWFELQRTAGPLGRAFGFALTVGRFSLSINAGWYVFFINWRGLGYINLAIEPVQFSLYLKGVTK